MKKILLIACVAMASMAVWAQDIIVTKDAKKIEAKILEVSKTEIKYKDFTYQDGPTFVLGVEDINSIIYANGKVELYDPSTADNTKDTHSPEDSSLTKVDVELEEGDKYVSEDGTVIIVYDKDKKLMFLHTTKPLMYNSYDARNIVNTICHIDGKLQVLTFYLSNKLHGVAIMSGLYAYLNNVKLQKYFKKHKPDSLLIDIPYETQQESYQLKRSN